MKCVVLLICSIALVRANVNITINSVPTADDPLSLCGDWHQFGLKCYKIVDSMTTKSVAKQKCESLGATLIQVLSSSDQDAILHMMKQYKQKGEPVLHSKETVLSSSSIVSSMWLGVNFGCESSGSSYNRYNSDCTKYYRWDGTNTRLSFTNWDEESPDSSGSSNLCVQMNLVTGKWSDVKCGRKSLIVCQKSNDLTIQSLYNTLRKTYLNLTKMIEQSTGGQRGDIKTGNQDQSSCQTLPIGFIYTQLPNQSSPQELWPQMNWTEVTEQYSGLFFRAEGKGSQPFGQIQQQNYSRISDIVAHGLDNTDGNYRFDKERGQTQFAVKEGQWTMINATQKQLHAISLFQTGAENVPANTAVRIWKRSG